ncbi:MAG: hypothetical protein WBA17_12505 [Saprospiraceae bacterium]
MLRNLAIPLIFALIFLSSCGPRLSPFTQRLYEEQNFTQEELKEIQFYLSEDLLLVRDFKDGERQITRGTVKIIDGREVEQVIIKRNTPGVFVFSPKENRFAVSFEDSDDAYLMFGPNPRNSNRFSILAGDWDRQRGVGTVTYRGLEWKLSSRDAYAALLIPIKRLRNQETTGRVAGGRKVN